MGSTNARYFVIAQCARVVVKKWYMTHKYARIQFDFTEIISFYSSFQNLAVTYSQLHMVCMQYFTRF